MIVRGAYGATGGKSELRRAGCWVMPSLGDEKDSATEKIPPRVNVVRVKWRGKSPPVSRVTGIAW
jgi:hypothetical protein